MTDRLRSRSGWLPALALASTAALTWPALAQDTEEEADEDTVQIAEVIDGPFFVTWAGAAVRELPDGSAARLETLPFGAQIFVTGRVQGSPWYRVELDDGRIGYVWTEVLEPVLIALPGTGGAAGQPELGVPGISDDNTMGMAQTIPQVGPTPSIFEGMVGPQDASDFYQFTLDDWTQLSVSLEGLSADADITLLDETGQYLADSAAAGADPEFIDYFAGPGSYFIEVYMYQGETTYQLVVTGEPADPPPADQAGDGPGEALALGDVTGSSVVQEEWIGAGDFADYYSFSVSESSTVTVTMDGMSSDADISLEDDFGSVLASSAEGGTNSEYMEVLLEPGEYYIAVVPFSGNTNYVIEVSAEPAGPAPEDGAGNSTGDARAVTLSPGETVELRDWVGPADVSDYYTFDLTAPGSFRLILDELTSDADVELLSGDGFTVLSSSLLAGPEAEQIQQQLSAGTYFVRVYVFSGATDYRLEMGVQ